MALKRYKPSAHNHVVIFAVFFMLAHAYNTSFAGVSNKGNSDFIHAVGSKLYLNGQPVTLKGVNFSNRYTEIVQPSKLLTSNHHSKNDYHKVVSFGMNAVRFAFRGEWYEKDERSFFLWIDKNIEWAHEAGIYLILDLHIPIGGFWLDPTSEKVDFSLWSDPELQQRNIRMWSAIAKRYRDETRIAAYDIFNEPVTTDKDGSQWKQLANKIVSEIRSADQNHLIIIGKLYGAEMSYTTEDLESQFLVNDTNVMYDFHFYEPIHYTHQYASWLPRPLSDGGYYPDDKILMPTGKQTYITSLTQEIHHTFKLSQDWQRFKLKRIKIENQEIKMGLPVFQVKGDSAGITLFDHFEVIEYTPNGESESIVKGPLSRLTIWDWWHWNQPQLGRSAEFKRVDNDGVNDTHSIAISAASGSNGYSGWSSDHKWFQVKKDHSYTMTGYLKSTVPNASAYFDIAFYGESIDSYGKGFLARNVEYLEWEFMKFYQFGIDNNVPISVMEFGLTHECFGKGGEKWVSDVIDIFLHHDVSFAYWDYHSDRMGVYSREAGKPPKNPNEELIRTFQKKLKK